MTFPDSVTVEVTAEDIAEGRPKLCAGCPIALAIVRSTIFGVVVDRFYCTLVGKGRSASYVLPTEASGFIQNFDAGRPVSPFTFTMTKQEAGK